jgi:hypothetical protein
VGSGVMRRVQVIIEAAWRLLREAWLGRTGCAFCPAFDLRREVQLLLTEERVAGNECPWNQCPSAFDPTEQLRLRLSSP